MALLPLYLTSGSSYKLPQDATILRVVVNVGQNPGNGYQLTTGIAGNASGALLAIPSVAAASVDTVVSVDLGVPVLKGQTIKGVFADSMIYFG